MQMSDHWKVILKKKTKTENDIKKAKRLTGIKFFCKRFYIHPAKSDEVFKKK